MGRWRDPTKYQEDGHSQCRKSLNWKLTLPLSTWKLKKRLRKPYRKRSDFRLFENSLVVLGLATAPQVRRADRALYHHKLTVSSLGGVCQSCTAPANLKCNTMKSRPKRGTEYRKSSRLEVFHLFRWYKHTDIYKMPKVLESCAKGSWNMLNLRTSGGGIQPFYKRGGVAELENAPTGRWSASGAGGWPSCAVSACVSHGDTWCTLAGTRYWFNLTSALFRGHNRRRHSRGEPATELLQASVKWQKAAFAECLLNYFVASARLNHEKSKFFVESRRK
jgi:hypothetical protein